MIPFETECLIAHRMAEYKELAETLHLLREAEAGRAVPPRRHIALRVLDVAGAVLRVIALRGRYAPGSPS